jgi:hypothetical protein
VVACGGTRRRSPSPPAQGIGEKGRREMN